jgi:hypothetical protein
MAARGRQRAHGTNRYGGDAAVRHGAQVGFAKRANTSEVVRADPPRAWSVRGIDGPIRALVDVSVTPLADVRSRVTIAVDFEGHGIGKLLIPLAILRQARKEMPANVVTLKQRLESAP